MLPTMDKKTCMQSREMKLKTFKVLRHSSEKYVSQNLHVYQPEPLAPSFRICYVNNLLKEGAYTNYGNI